MPGPILGEYWTDSVHSNLVVFSKCIMGQLSKQSSFQVLHKPGVAIKVKTNMDMDDV